MIRLLPNHTSHLVFRMTSKMANDRLDLVIFGATGFTGRYAVNNMFNLSKKYPDLKWGVAGRSRTKLETLMEDMAKEGHDTSTIPVLEAEVSSAGSLAAMCRRARVLVNCCGPYRLYGEPVVTAAIENGCHHVDVSGEPQFIESMQLKYHAAAAAAGVFVVSACGFDSVPNDLGVLYLQRHFPGVLHSVESYLSVKVDPAVAAEAKETGLVHYGTWESLVYSLANYGEVKQLRKQLYPTPMPKSEPKLQHRFVVHKADSRWCVPFPGADRSVLYRTHRHLHEEEKQHPVQFAAYVKTPGLVYAVAAVVTGMVLFLLSKLPFTSGLLLRHPSVFSLGAVTRRGPSARVAASSTAAFILKGRGWSDSRLVGNTGVDTEMVAKVVCKNPGYGMTTTALLLCAITILKERDNMPKTGGVLTTGVAFRKTNLINTLIENDITFQIVKQDEITNEDKNKNE